METKKDGLCVNLLMMRNKCIRKETETDTCSTWSVLSSSKQCLLDERSEGAAHCTCVSESSALACKSTLLHKVYIYIVSTVIRTR